jgi:hypothetical protein
LRSGDGLFAWEFIHYLKADSMLSVGSVKGQDKWLERQHGCFGAPTDRDIERYIEKYKPDVILFSETPFNFNLFEIARKHGIKTIGVGMHESPTFPRLNPDVLVCLCASAWEKASHPNKVKMFLPIGLELFPYRERSGHVFVFNLGYIGFNDRRQIGATLQAFKAAGGKNTLIIRAQANEHLLPDMPHGYEKSKNSDYDYTYPRIIRRIYNYDSPTDIYREGDISIQVSAYGGYERMILESMASGMPTLTMNADPMNMFQPDEDFLMPPHPEPLKSSHTWDTIYNRVDVDELADKFRWLAKIDTRKYSHAARKVAKSMSWESGKYTQAWRDIIEG